MEARGLVINRRASTGALLVRERDRLLDMRAKKPSPHQMEAHLRTIIALQEEVARLEGVFAGLRFKERDPLTCTFA